MSDLHPVTARFERMRATAAARYGVGSQAMSFLYYEELISTRTVLAADPGSPVLRDRAGDLVAIIQDRFDAAGVQEPARSHHSVVGTDPVVVEYDRERFEQHYRHVLASLGRSAEQIRDREHALATLTPGASYLYVVDEHGALWVWPEVHRLADVMFAWAPGRAPVPGRVVHPMLVPDRLRARAAGELVLAGSAECLFVIANLRSGHFRPPASCAVEMRVAGVRAFGLGGQEGIDVFTMPGIPVRHDHGEE